MKKTLEVISFFLVVASMTGCATPYMADRGHDAADIFTATVGYGAGAKARVGPVQAALFANRDVTGLRSGQFFWRPEWGREIYAPVPLSIEWFGFCGGDAFSTFSETEIERKKGVDAVGFFPCLTFDDHAHYYTQIEVAVALGPSIRLGFNPVELLDFILGWATIDIFNDDLSRLREEWRKARPPKRYKTVMDSLPDWREPHYKQQREELKRKSNKGVESDQQ